MIVKDFTKAFMDIPKTLDDVSTNLLESRYMYNGDFAWNLAHTEIDKFMSFMDDIVSIDLGINEGEIIKFTSSMGCRMIFIGTYVGNVVVHLRGDVAGSLDNVLESTKMAVYCYTPKMLRNILGNNKPIVFNELFTFTGLQDDSVNLGIAFKELRENNRRI